MAGPSVPYWLLPFDRDADFVFASWPNGFTVAGKQPVIGELVDKSSLSTRMLKAYYEKRWIRRAEEADLKHLKITDRPFAPPLANGGFVSTPPQGYGVVGERANDQAEVMPIKRKRVRKQATA